MRTLCYSIRLESLERISPKAFKATAFDGTTAIIPASQVMGEDYDVSKSDAYWISAWILERKNLQYSSKKRAWFDDHGHRLPDYTVTHHTPERISAKDNNEISELKR